MSDLLSLFESIDLEWVRGCVEQRFQENLHLEFKTIESERDLKPSDRRIFAKVITGFANADGGIAVWGIIARKDKDGVDCAHGVKPIADIEFCLSRFNSLTAEAADPAVDGVQHKAIREAGKAGYLATYVPPSEAKPHEARLGERRYWKRCGDSTRGIDRYELLEMGERRRAPALSLFTEAVCDGSGSGSGETTYDSCVVVGIRNSGYGIARFPFLTLRVHAPYAIAEWGLDGNGSTGLPRLVTRHAENGMATFGGGSDDVVHIDSTLQVTAIKARFKESVAAIQDLSIEYRIAAAGFRPVDGSHVVRGAEIVKRILERFPDAFPKLQA